MEVGKALVHHARLWVDPFRLHIESPVPEVAVGVAARRAVSVRQIAAEGDVPGEERCDCSVAEERTTHENLGEDATERPAINELAIRQPDDHLGRTVRARLHV